MGLTNQMTNHIFSNYADGMEYARKQLVATGPAMRSQFCELNGWNVQVYCNKMMNDFIFPGRVAGRGHGHLNAAGIYLGSALDDGLTRWNNLSGRIFVTGRRQTDGKPLNQDVLWGLLVFICDAMDHYPGSPRRRLERWARQYKEGTWEPPSGDGGCDIYSNDFSGTDHR